MLLNYYEKGKLGDPIVIFIHGSASDATVWLKELNLIAAHGYHCFAFDLRGHGETKEKMHPLQHMKLDIDTHIYDVRRTLDTLGIFPLKDPPKEIPPEKQITIVTHSFGGIVAINIAKMFPQLVKKLVLVSLPPKLVLPMKLFLEVLLGKPIGFIQKNLDWFQKTPIKSRYKSSITTNAHVLQEIFKHVKDWNSFEIVPKLKCPIDFAAGRFDLVATAGDIYKLHRRIPNSTYHLFKWASHALMEDQPEEFERWLLECLKEPSKVKA